MIEVSETHQGKPKKKSPIPQNKRSEVAKALPHEHSSLSAQRKTDIELIDVLWAIMIFHNEHDIISYPELSFVELYTKSNHLDCYWELIQVRQWWKLVCLNS